MGRADNRRSPKARQRAAWRKKKARLRKKIEASKAAQAGAGDPGCAELVVTGAAKELDVACLAGLQVVSAGTALRVVVRSDLHHVVPRTGVHGVVACGGVDRVVAVS